MPLRRLLLLSLLALGCATAAPAGPTPTPRKYGATGLASTFEGKTLYQCTTGTGAQIPFNTGKLTVTVLIRTGTVWLRPRSVADSLTWSPASPVPSANGLADGWIRLGDGQSATWDPNPAALTSSSSSDRIAALDEWCEVQGDIVVVSH